jgi:hypothetical protein
MVFNAAFNNISVISWLSVLLVDETVVHGENHWPAASHDKLYQIILYWVHLTWAGFQLKTLVVIGTDCIGSYKSNYYHDHVSPIIIYIIFMYKIQYYCSTETKEVACIGYYRFLFPHGHQGRHQSMNAENETRYIQYGQLLLFQ